MENETPQQNPAPTARKWNVDLADATLEQMMLEMTTRGNQPAVIFYYNPERQCMEVTSRLTPENMIKLLQSIVGNPSAGFQSEGPRP